MKTPPSPPSWPPDRFADLGGRRLRYWDVGEGTPIVLECGLGTGASTWSRIIGALSERGRVIAYDRAGLGASDGDPAKRTAARMADDLGRLLEIARVEPPYVLVGHSYGGLVARLFAHRRPADVAGLVLIDATHEDSAPTALLALTGVSYSVLWLLAQMGALLPILRRQGVLEGMSADEERYIRSTIRRDVRGAWREASGIKHGIREIRAARGTDGRLEVPVVVLSAPGTTKQRGYAAKTFKRLHELHASWVDESLGGYHRIAPDGVRHYVHIDAPDLVLNAVDHVLSRGDA